MPPGVRLTPHQTVPVCPTNQTQEIPYLISLPPTPLPFPFPSKHTHTHTHTHSIDFKIKSLPLEDKKLKLQIWDTAGQERFRTITTAYYRGAMGILLVYDVTDERSFANVKTWMKQIEQHASENVNRVLIGNKCDAAPADRRVTLEQGKKLAEEYGIKFFETSAKEKINVDEAFLTIAKDIVQRYVWINVLNFHG